MSKERYRLITEYPKDEFFDNKQVVKFDSYEVVRTLNQQADKIADLEAKLVEVKNSCDYYMKRSNDLVREIGEYKKHIRFKGKEITELKQQLAELDSELTENVRENECLKEQLAEKETYLSLARNEINTLKHNLNISQEHDNVMCEQYFEKCKHYNQDKIEFAIAELEKVKEHFINIKTPTLGVIRRSEMVMYIDQQIQQLNASNSMPLEDKGEN